MYLLYSWLGSKYKDDLQIKLIKQDNGGEMRIEVQGNLVMHQKKIEQITVVKRNRFSQPGIQLWKSFWKTSQVLTQMQS